NLKRKVVDRGDVAEHLAEADHFDDGIHCLICNRILGNWREEARSGKWWESGKVGRREGGKVGRWVAFLWRNLLSFLKMRPKFRGRPMDYSRHLLIDAYNVIHQWPELRRALRQGSAAAREALATSVRVIH